jgi:ribosomal protein S18 acetylase RimI-like enzyme
LGKLEDSKSGGKRGYIAMLAVEQEYRGLSIGRTLATNLLTDFLNHGVEEVVFISIYHGLNLMN